MVFCSFAIGEQAERTQGIDGHCKRLISHGTTRHRNPSTASSQALLRQCIHVLQTQGTGAAPALNAYPADKSTFSYETDKSTEISVPSASSPANRTNSFGCIQCRKQ
ncbi:hypothetical protein PVAP13_6NG015144 [Panicum virgatum]|uniref:Uncharacterized protein n=1 Tax=Panicum virgatum TaxID=38727 RepID=A0A8T0QSZ4_PANVG|nr:hypothetical protein PVAP13_6NG015144 [Panicum virgatum]